MFEEEMDQKTYHLFITQVAETDEEYQRFTGRLEDAHDFSYENHSDNGLSGTANIDELKKILKGQITDTDLVIVLSGLYPTYKNLIMTVLNLARELEKPVLLIRPYGMENVPPELEKLSNGVIGWSASCIAASIKGLLNDEVDEYCEF
ncbi:MAG: hypothetical protein Q8R66_11525 [Methanobacteriaceae archaeon]|nr:hypothetical protein [Methanobacteriaceae archaeon]